MPILSSVFKRAQDIPGNILETSRKMSLPRGVLLCRPDYFQVVDVKNPFMNGQIGQVNHDVAQQQWDQLKLALQRLPLEVHVLEPVPGCEDMVFAANQTFVGLDSAGQKVCVASRMKYASRRREVPAFVDWFQAHSYQTVQLSGLDIFEGGGDAVWHPGRALIWAGHGPRSQNQVYPELAAIFEAPVLLLDLITERFYHLDTCFCPLSSEMVLIHPPAFSPASLEMIRTVFPVVIEADPEEAGELMACNAASFLSRYVVIQRGATRVIRHLKGAGLQVAEVETGEFMKSGGSVFCMKMNFWT